MSSKILCKPPFGLSAYDGSLSSNDDYIYRMTWCLLRCRIWRCKCGFPVSLNRVPAHPISVRDGRGSLAVFLLGGLLNKRCRFNAKHMRDFLDCK